jgi:cytochrome c peroxidase
MFMFKRNRQLTLRVLTTTLIIASITGCSQKETTPAESEVEPTEAQVATVETPIEPTTQSVDEVTPILTTTSQDYIKEHLDTLNPVRKLGGRLFFDTRLSNPGANLATSCATCHVPPFLSDGKQMYSDVNPFSVIPANSSGGKVTTVRNTPTLQDVAPGTSFGLDGGGSSLKSYMDTKLTSLHLGWEEDDKARAYNEFHALLLNDVGEDVFAEGSYIEQFKAALDINIEAMSQEDVVAQMIGVMMGSLRSITTTKSSSYDALAFLNRFEEKMDNENDSPQALAGRISARIANQEGRVLIRFPNVYTEEAYQGFKTFVRVEPTFSSSVEGLEENIGNCIACHTPPSFSDGAFHNTGVAQTSYDAVHGEGAFAKLDPATATFGRVTIDDTTKVDLGRYNVNQEEAAIGAFKTPRLRNITLSAPYNHDGQKTTLEDLIRQKIKVSQMAKAGTLTNPDPAYLTMNISESDVKNLAAFLTTLQEVPIEEFRDYRIDNVRIRQDVIKEEATYSN